jgi:hypothetical protein
VRVCVCFGVVVWFFGAVFGWAFGCQRACGVCSRLLEMADFRGSPRLRGEPVGGGQNLPHSQFAPKLSCNELRRGERVGVRGDSCPAPIEPKRCALISSLLEWGDSTPRTHPFRRHEPPNPSYSSLFLLVCAVYKASKPVRSIPSAPGSGTGTTANSPPTSVKLPSTINSPSPSNGSKRVPK